MTKRYFQPEMETMPLEKIRMLQSEKLVKQIKSFAEEYNYKPRK